MEIDPSRTLAAVRTGSQTEPDGGAYAKSYPASSATVTPPWSAAATGFTHWNAAGEPDATTSKQLALWLFPALAAGLFGVFAAIPRIGPLRENIAEFRAPYDWFVVIVTGYLVLVHAGVVAFNHGYEFDFTALILTGSAGLFYCVGVFLPHAEPNWFAGIRTPWTLNSDDVWDRTHALGSRLFKLTAVLTLVGRRFDDLAVSFLLVPLLLTVGVTTGYSYHLYEQLEREPDSAPGSNR